MNRSLTAKELEGMMGQEVRVVYHDIAEQGSALLRVEMRSVVHQKLIERVLSGTVSAYKIDHDRLR